MTGNINDRLIHTILNDRKKTIVYLLFIICVCTVNIGEHIYFVISIKKITKSERDEALQKGN